MPPTKTETPVIPNFRDVGGHLTADGRRVRSGQLFRSVDLSGLDDQASAWLAGLGIRIVFDLRTPAERQRRPSRPPVGARVVALDVLADSEASDPAVLFELMQDPRRASEELADGGTDRFYLAAYREFVHLGSARAAYAELLRTLTHEGMRPALVHCTTGKDRTGWAVSILLLCLGVPAQTVMDEYLSSDAEIRDAFGWLADDFVARGGDRTVIEPLMSVRAAWLEVALEEVAVRFGSFEAYLADGLGLDPGTLRALRRAFLEPD
jgi:protein-tyrosine phosphatase